MNTRLAFRVPTPLYALQQLAPPPVGDALELASTRPAMHAAFALFPRSCSRHHCVPFCELWDAQPTYPESKGKVAPAAILAYLADKRMDSDTLSSAARSLLKPM